MFSHGSEFDDLCRSHVSGDTRMRGEATSHAGSVSGSGSVSPSWYAPLDECSSHAPEAATCPAPGSLTFISCVFGELECRISLYGSVTRGPSCFVAPFVASSVALRLHCLAHFLAKGRTRCPGSVSRVRYHGDPTWFAEAGAVQVPLGPARLPSWLRLAGCGVEASCLVGRTMMSQNL